MFGNRVKRRKEKRIKYLFFLCLDCNEKENEKKIYVFFSLDCGTIFVIGKGQWKPREKGVVCKIIQELLFIVF